jgi:hypothetical protein
MTFEQKLAKAIEVAQETANKAHAQAIDTLLTNPAFIDAQRVISAKNVELTKLNSIISQLNQIKPFVASDGATYGIKCYPVSFFGTGLAQVIGIIASSRSAFTDDLALQFSAITGISLIELAEANEALGSPAYLSKDGIVSPTVHGNIAKFRALLESILLKLDVREFNVNSITEDRVNLWYARAELNVQTKQAERELTVELMGGEQFTMAD